MTNALKEH